MPRPLDSLIGSSVFPQRADVVIIGGGIVGVSAALVLAERGVSVVVCEKGEIGGEQSSRNWGLCLQSNRSPAEMPLMIKTMEIWKGLSRRVGFETGFVQKGLLFTCDTEADIDSFDRRIFQKAKHFGLDTRLLSSREIAEFLPGTTRRLAGALYTPSDGSAEPQHAAVAIAKGAIARGAIVLTQCAVRGLETSAGRVSAVVTEKGTIRCGTAVLAAGAWSRLFLGNIGIALPVLNVHTSIQATEPMEGPPDRVVYGSDFGFRKRLDGGWNLGQLEQTVPIVPDSLWLLPAFRHLIKTYLGGFTITLGAPFLDALRQRRKWKNNEVSPFENQRVQDIAVHHHILKRAKAKLDRAVPWFKNARIRYQWAGVIDMLPDETPVISFVDSHPGLFIATGFSGHGFGIGPGAGQLVADMVTDASPIADARPFNFARLQPSRPGGLGVTNNGSDPGQVAGAQ